MHSIIDRVRRLVGITVLYHKKSDTGDIFVTKTGNVTTLTFGGKLTQSRYEERAVLTSVVWHYFLLAPYFLSENMLHDNPQLGILGFGTGTTAILYDKFWPQFIITGVEISHDVLVAARTFFPLPKGVTIVEDDAIRFLKKTHNLWTILLIDLFDATGTISQVSDHDFLAATVGHIIDNGVIVINFCGSPTVKVQIITFYHSYAFQVFSVPINISGIHNDILFITKTQVHREAIIERCNRDTRKELQEVLKVAKKTLQAV